MTSPLLPVKPGNTIYTQPDTHLVCYAVNDTGSITVLYVS